MASGASLAAAVNTGQRLTKKLAANNKLAKCHTCYLAFAKKLITRTSSSAVSRDPRARRVAS